MRIAFPFHTPDRYQKEMYYKEDKTPGRVVPNRDAKYLGLAWMIAGFSKDPDTQVGALIVDPEENVPLGWGYNGPPSTTKDNEVNWARPHKYDWIFHAEENAIFHSQKSVKGTHLYLTHIPCKKCMLTIAKHKISKVIFSNPTINEGSSLSKNSDGIAKTKEIARANGITLQPFEESLAWLEDWILNIKELDIF